MYDLLIVGGGPAGLSAAVNGRRWNKRVVLVTKEEMSSRLRQAHRVDNYLGISQISGADLAERFQRHALEEGVEIREDEIINLRLEENSFYGMGNSDQYEAKAVILATGVPQKASIPGEAKFIGQGVSYCAGCDGMFYKGKTVVMISYIPDGEKKANFLADICKKVYYLPQYRIEQRVDPKIEIIRARPVEILGEERLLGLKTSQGELTADGIFIERAGLPPEQLYPELAVEGDSIRVSRGMETNIPGLFAAGDCTGKPWQIAKAVGEGQIAVSSAVEYLDKIR